MACPCTPIVATTAFCSASITLTLLDAVLTTYTSFLWLLAATPVGSLPTRMVLASWNVAEINHA